MRTKENMHLPKYKTNKSVREKIDKLLFENARIWANLGTGTEHDLKTRQIKELDEVLYNRLCPYGIDS